MTCQLVYKEERLLKVINVLRQTCVYIVVTFISSHKVCMTEGTLLIIHSTLEQHTIKRMIMELSALNIIS